MKILLLNQYKSALRSVLPDVQFIEENTWTSSFIINDRIYRTVYLELKKKGLDCSKFMRDAENNVVQPPKIQIHGKRS